MAYGLQPKTTMIHTLHESPKYKKFTQDRNKALEQINHNAQLDISRLTFEVLDRITGFVSHMAIEGKLSINNLHYLTKQLDTYTWQQFYGLLPLIVGRIKRMRKATYVLTYLAELEAIARATRKTNYSNRHKFKMDIAKQVDSDTLTGQKLDARIWVILSQLQADIMSAFRRSIAMDKEPKEVVDAIKKAYPQIKGYRLPPRTLKPLREADRSKDEEKKEWEFYTDLTTDEDWELAVDAYKATELPSSRFDTTPSYDEETGYRRYSWELEQDINDDFVQQVRDGQVEAANDLGVKDFVWVAIIDNKTCELCCLPRNGKTTSEIESMLKNGELDEDCEAIVSPAHQNCRCDIVPVSSTDEVEGPDWKEFSEWLDS